MISLLLILLYSYYYIVSAGRTAICYTILNRQTTALSMIWPALTKDLTLLDLPKKNDMGLARETQEYLKKKKKSTWQFAGQSIQYMHWCIKSIPAASIKGTMLPSRGDEHRRLNNSVYKWSSSLPGDINASRRGTTNTGTPGEDLVGRGSPHRCGGRLLTRPFFWLMCTKCRQKEKQQEKGL